MSINKDLIIEKSLIIAKECAQEVNLNVTNCEYVFENGIKILRICISSSENVTIDDCTKLSELISAKLDIEDYIDEEYYLEVCSEGIEKKLNTDEDIKNSINKYIFVTFNEKVENLKECYGDLIDFDGNLLTIKCNFKGRIKKIQFEKEKIDLIRLAVKF